MKELLVRSVTGVVYVVILLGAPILGPWFFFGAYFILCVFALNEFFRLSSLEATKPLLIPGILVGIWPLLHQFMHFQTNWEANFLGILISLILLAFVYELFRRHSSPILNLSMLLMAFFYIGVPFGLLPQLAYSPSQEDYSPWLIAFVLVVIWVHDTGAYLIGHLLGKHPLIKHISPKKTVEGLFGGLALGAVAIWCFTLLPSGWESAKLGILGVVIMLFANLGDLFESMWKRHLGIKDSGKSLPGHGGWLDRLDSLLFAIPAVFVTLQFLD